MNFKEEIFKKHSIAYQLAQIARGGRYYLSPLRVICYISDNCTYEQLVNILKENDIFDERLISDDTIALVEYPNGNFPLTLRDESIPDLKISDDAQNNCGYELHSYWDETASYMSRGEQKWFLEQLKKNNLSQYEDYTISVDNLEAPTKAFIYRLDDNDNPHLELTCNL